MNIRIPILEVIRTKIRNFKSKGNPICHLVPIPIRVGILNSFFLSTLLILGIGLPPPDLAAQVSQTAIYEHPHKSSDHEFIVIPMGEQGIALIRDTDKYEGNKKSWEVIIVDSTLNESWTTK